MWRERDISRIAEMGKKAEAERDKNKHLSAEDLKEKMATWIKDNFNVTVCLSCQLK